MNKIMNGIVSAVTHKATNAATSTVMNLLKSKFIYTVDMSSAGVMNITRGLRRVFIDTCEYVNFMSYQNSTDGYRIDIGPSADNSMMSSHSESSMVTYHGTLIVLTIESSVDSNQNRYNFHVYLSCIRTAENVRNVKELIDRIIRYGRKKSVDEASHLIMTQGPRMMSREIYGNLRSFDDVFISDADERLLKESLDAFVSKRNWYIEHNIGYHFGILLYGVPGSGKSSLAQAISEYINARTIIVSGDDIMDIPEQVFRGYIPSDTNGVDQFQTLIVEDIDCGLTADASMRRIFGGAYDSKNNKDSDKRTNGLASVLNQLDGINSLSNTVYVFTTNYIDKLDPALIRPGRIDLKIEIGYVTTETFNKFLVKHYGKTVDPDMKIKDGLTFAELQTCVMKEYSFNQIVDIVRA